jgi:hypothetical protein
MQTAFGLANKGDELPFIEAGHLARPEMENSNENYDTRRFATLGLGVGGAFAAGAGGAGAPAGWEPSVYGAQAFSDHRNDPVVHFLGKGTVLGKMLNYNSRSEQVAAATTSAKGG